MYALIYLSNFNELVEDDIIEIATKSAVQNRKIGVTGFLTRRKKYFIQYLEGEERDVLKLMNKIEKDERHQVLHVIPLDKNGIDKLFENWSMRYISQNDEESNILDDSLVETIVDIAHKNYDQTLINAQIYSIILKLSRIFHLPKLN